MDAQDLQRRWKEVVKTIGFELNTAAPGDKAKWVAAQKAAEAVIEALTPVLALEKAACGAWQEARREPSTQPKPVFKIVR